MGVIFVAILYFEKEKTFLLQGKVSTYAFKIDDGGYVCHLYWGEKITDCADLPTPWELAKRFLSNDLKVDVNDTQEYRGFGGKSFIEPALKVTFADGTRNVFLKYESHSINGDILKINLRDPVYPIYVTLNYRVCSEFDVIERYATIKNAGNKDFVLESAFSANWHLPNKDKYRLTYFTGAYCWEYQKNQDILKGGRKVLETRRGLSGPDAIPFFMIDNGEATEDFGGVYFGSIVWSGNWKLIFERDHASRTVVTGGINNFDFEYCLEPGQEYDTPMFFAGYTNGGFGNTTRNLHKYELSEIVHPKEKKRILPVIYNTHGSLENKTNEENVLKEVEEAHKLGIELFVLDGGWTGIGDIDSPINNGQSHRLGYGTWTVNKERFPNGLKVISDKVHSYGMKFGLWIEPESVFPLNELVTEHPDWIVGYDNRDFEITGMGCYSLNMANDDACDYMINRLCELISENNIDYIKNDFNRNNPHLGWRKAPLKHQKESWDKYVRNMWRCYRTIKERFPDLIFENSAGGGKRTDLGMLYFAGRMHRSDNQDPLDSIKIHEGMSYFIPPKFAGGACFVSDLYTLYVNRRETSMEYQAHVGMLSGLSVSIKLADLSEERKAELARLIELHKKIRNTVQLGEFYRLMSAYDKEYGVYQYLETDKSRAVVFILGQNMQFGKMPERVCLKDLDPDAKYEVVGHGTYYKYSAYPPRYPAEIPEKVKNYGIFTGRGLMNVGIQFELQGHARSEILIVAKID